MSMLLPVLRKWKINFKSKSSSCMDTFGIHCMNIHSCAMVEMRAWHEQNWSGPVKVSDKTRWLNNQTSLEYNVQFCLPFKTSKLTHVYWSCKKITWETWKKQLETSINLCCGKTNKGKREKKSTLVGSKIKEKKKRAQPTERRRKGHVGIIVHSICIHSYNLHRCKLCRIFQAECVKLSFLSTTATFYPHSVASVIIWSSKFPILST